MQNTRRPTWTLRRAAGAVLIAQAAGSALACAEDPAFCADPTHLSLADYCDTFDCSVGTEADALRGLECVAVTSPLMGTFRLEGCGIVTVGKESGEGGSSISFDAQTGAVVGRRISSDTSFGPCHATTVQYAAGKTNDRGACPDARYLYCGDPDGFNGPGDAGAPGDAAASKPEG